MTKKTIGNLPGKDNTMTLEEIKSFSDRGGKGIFLAEDELKKLAEQAAQNEQRLAEALTKGKTDDYARLLAEKDIIAEKIRQNRDYIARQPRYATRDDIIIGFNQAAAAYNVSFRKKHDAYMRAKKELYAMFCEMFKEREKMLEARKVVNRLINADTLATALDIPDASLTKLEGITKSASLDLKLRGHSILGDAAFFLDCANEEDIKRMSSAFLRIFG